jgi:hypothetical protein
VGSRRYIAAQAFNARQPEGHLSRQMLLSKTLKLSYEGGAMTVGKKSENMCSQTNTRFDFGAGAIRDRV